MATAHWPGRHVCGWQCESCGYSQLASLSWLKMSMAKTRKLEESSSKAKAVAEMKMKEIMSAAYLAALSRGNGLENNGINGQPKKIMLLKAIEKKLENIIVIYSMKSGEEMRRRNEEIRSIEENLSICEMLSQSRIEENRKCRNRKPK